MAEENLTIFQVDTFTSTCFSGNPAGVCVSDFPLEEKVMANVAQELGATGTAFVFPLARTSLTKANRFGIRCFGRVGELSPYEHAIIAAAKVLSSIYEVCSSGIMFVSGDSEIVVRRDKDFFFVALPAASLEAHQLSDTIYNALRLDYADLGARVTECRQSSCNGDLVLRFRQQLDLLDVHPDFTLLAEAMHANNYREIIITAPSEPPYDYSLRTFSPICGVNESPAAPRSQCCLAPYWGALLNKKKMLALQASRRRGELLVEVAYDLGKSRVIVSGRAVIVMEAIINLVPAY